MGKGYRLKKLKEEERVKDKLIPIEKVGSILIDRSKARLNKGMKDINSILTTCRVKREKSPLNSGKRTIEEDLVRIRGALLEKLKTLTIEEVTTDIIGVIEMSIYNYDKDVVNIYKRITYLQSQPPFWPRLSGPRR